MIAENLKNLRKRIEQTCQKCGRRSEDVRLVAVSKTFPVEAIQEAIDAGHIDFGENYVQELQEKYKAFAERIIHWHFIGHLQSNKVKYIAEYINLIHSVDDLNLGKEISKRSEQCNRIQDVLVEIHTTDEARTSYNADKRIVAVISSSSLWIDDYGAVFG
jgi:hypothetical protein